MKTDHPAIRLQSACSQLLQAVGEDPAREGLAKTPERYAKALQELTSGYEQDIDELVNGAIFHESYSEMVLVRDIEFYSLCEHHVLPFFGRVHVAYIPDGKIIGLSKIPRLVHAFARRLQVQERLTDQIAEALQGILNPAGVGVVVEGQHMCMMMRGVQTQNGMMLTSAMRGQFLKDRRTRDEFMSLVQSKGGNR